MYWNTISFADLSPVGIVVLPMMVSCGFQPVRGDETWIKVSVAEYEEVTEPRIYGRGGWLIPMRSLFGAEKPAVTFDRCLIDVKGRAVLVSGSVRAVHGSPQSKIVVGVGHLQAEEVRVRDDDSAETADAFHVNFDQVSDIGPTGTFELFSAIDSLSYLIVAQEGVPARLYTIGHALTAGQH